jgi:gliding motility-associated-like protein
VTITQPASAFTVTHTQTNVNCFGGSTGSITLAPVGGTTAYGAPTWTGGLTGSNPTNVAAGSYTYTIADANGCTQTGTVTITQPVSAFTVTHTQTNVNCFGASTGSITLTPTGGTTAYGAPTWTGGLTGLNPTNVAAGSYTYTIADANGCTQTGTVTITQPVSAFTVTHTQTNVNCFGGSTGSITLTPAGGTTAYGAPTWTGGLTGLNPTNVAAGSYTYTIADANGCTQTGTVTITEPAAAFTVTTTQTNVNCFGGSTGSITLAPAGGTTPYGAPTWTGGLTGLNPINVAAGSYTYTIADANGCTQTGTVTITQPASAFTVTTTQTNVNCFGASTGSITLTPAGGTTAYGAPTWTGGLTGLNPTNVAAGSYTYTIADANGCTQTGTVTITQPASAFTVTTAQTNIACYNTATGTITLTPSGGTTPYGAVTWTGGLTGLNPTNVAAGSYTYTIADANGCTQTGTVTVTQPAAGLVVTSVQTNVLCFGDNTGSITLTLTGGAMPYSTVAWTDGATGTSRTNLAAGSYTYNVTDANGCPASGTITITQPAAAFSVTATSTNVNCFGMSTGSITLTLSGGTTSYGTVNWTDGATGASRTGLAAGTYTYNVSDANGCPQTGSVTITEPATAFGVAETQVNVLCYGSSTGSVTLTPSGGTTPYATAEWLDLYIGDIRNNLAAGTYYYADSDNNGCLVTGTVVITQPASAFTVTPTETDPLCHGQTGAITLNLAGGTTPYGSVTWSDGGTGTTRSVPAGSYSYTVADANGCTETGTVTVNQPSPIVPVVVLLSNISCFGANDGSVVVNASGGDNNFTYELDGIPPFQSTGAFSNLTFGAHTVFVQDGNGCDTMITFNITEPTLVAVPTITTVNDSCFGQCNGIIIATTSGGTPPYEYSDDGVNYYPSDTFTGLCAGSYTISVRDNNQCGNNAPATISQPTQVVVSPVDSFAPSCYNGSNAYFDVIASGGSGSGYTYAINGGPYQSNGGHFTGVTPGQYNVTAQDGNGCTGSYTITVPNVTATSSFTTSAINDSCYGASDGSIAVTVTGTSTYSFLWSNGSAAQDLTGLPVGTYTVEVSDANGCVVYGTDSTVTITQPGQISATSTMTPVVCFGDSNGCINVTPSGGTQPFTSSWTNGSNATSGCTFKAGSYSDTLTDSYGCQYIYANVVVTQPNPVAVIVDSVTPVSCSGSNNGEISISDTAGTPGYTYLWSQGSTSDPVTGLAAGTYEVTVTDSKGCTATDTIAVGINNPITYTATKSNVLCTPLQNGSISLTVSGGSPGYQYIWSNGQTTSAIYNLPVGIDSVTVTDSRGCFIDTGFLITNDSAFATVAVPDTAATINQGDMIQLAVDITKNNGAGDVVYSWEPSTGLSSSNSQTTNATPTTTTQYVITSTTDSGCVSTTEILIIVNPQHQLYIPNGFTPNNDGVNDYWEAFGNKKTWLFCEAQVYDRWGEKVFESNDINFQWDGKYKGEYVLPGEYVYVFKVVFVDDYSVTNKGTITVIR